MIRVLLVDDHEAVREGLCVLIDQQDDMRVVADIGDGRFAVERVRETGAEVAVLDLTMPRISGLAVARLLKEETTCAFIAFTRHDDEAFVQEVMAAGAAGYVLKQSRSSELLAAIRAAAAGDHYLDTALLARRRMRTMQEGGDATQLSERETAVLRKAAVGVGNKDIATALNISVKTVEVHKANAMRKLNLRGRADLLRYAMLHDWLQEPD